MKQIKGNIQIVLLMFLVLILLNGSYSILKVLSTVGSYSTGYQGARAQYSGVQWEGIQYTSTDTHQASRARFDTTLSFDPDGGARDGVPNLEGEMTSIFVPSESLSNLADWIPSDWLTSVSYMTNPREAYEWEIENKSYRMEEWILRWYFSISAEWDESGHIILNDNEWYNQKYSNTEIWFQIDLTPVWYFEGAERAYFAIAKLKLAEVKLDALDNQDNVVKAEKAVSVKPDSKMSILPVYYSEFAKSSEASKTSHSYEGRSLNPDLFTDTVYTYITLENFGTWAWQELAPLPTWRYKGDVVTMAIDVHVFVIGQWDVKDIENLEDYEDYGRTAKVGGAGFSIGDWFALPENRLLMVLLAAFFVFILFAVAFPSVLISIFAIFGSGRKRRG
jgi:hypothetical protein